MKAQLNGILNQLSTYRLMTVTLTFLWVVSLALSFLGLHAYRPTALVFSVVVLVAAGILSNRLFGMAFKVQPHDESSYITALILFFVFTPSATIPGLTTLGLIAVVASGSKYILAFRGRHFFNPAGIAAVIAGLVGLAYASWWVATPALMPATAFLAMLILYKTGSLKLGGVFLVISSPLIIAALLFNGQNLNEAFTALSSWPLLFLIGFMVTEPLTLPPRFRQRIFVGALLAVLVAVPLQFGDWSTSPEIALMIGNLVALAFIQKGAVVLELSERRRLTPTTEEFVFTPNRPVRFLAGQYVEITVPHKNADSRGQRRMFSLAFAPGEATVRLGIKFSERSSSFKQALRALEPGAAVRVTHVGGDFILPKDPHVPLLFIAAGIGITPFISHLLQLKNLQESRDIVLIYSVRHGEEIAYADILVAAGIKIVIVTGQKSVQSSHSWQVVNASQLTAKVIADAVVDMNMRHVYIAGPPLMVDSIADGLGIEGVNRIKKDYFTGF